MTSFKLLDQQSRRIFTTVVMLVATIVPALSPVLVSAAQITDRSITLSSSTANDPSVTYAVDFTAIGGAGAVVIDFCSNSPLLGASCTAPGGFDVSSATASAGFTVVGADTTANKITMTGTISAGDVPITLTGVHNPTATGPLYARIVTFTDGTGAHGYSSTAPGTHIDDGGVAMDITNSIGVNAAVLESMTFCVSNTVITGSGCSAGVNTPSLTLGETVGSVKALSASAISTGDIFTQISTNAASGAVVNIKSGNACGGLKRVDASGCDIAPALTGGFTFGQAKIGVLAAADTSQDTALSASGTYQAHSATGYNASTYTLNYDGGNSTGVTSAYGDPILDTNSTQPSNKQMKLTFGASISNNTPAGSYANNYSLIATGKF